MAVKPGTITLAFGDDEYPFRLATGEWQEIYRKVLKLLLQLGVGEENAMASATPMAIYKRIAGGNPLPGEVPEIILQGLIGGGMTPKDAVVLRQRYCIERPLLECVPVAQAIVLVGLMGPPEADAKKKKTAAAGSKNSHSAKSMATAQPSASAHERSTT